MNPSTLPASGWNAGSRYPSADLLLTVSNSRNRRANRSKLMSTNTPIDQILADIKGLRELQGESREAFSRYLDILEKERARIAEEILRGVSTFDEYQRLLCRREALKFAIDCGKPTKLQELEGILASRD